MAEHAEGTDVGVLIVDDQPLFLGVLRTVVGRTAGFIVVGEAGDGAAAVEQVRALGPRLVLMDIHMPVLDGIQATRRIVAERPDAAVVLLSSYDQADLPPEVAASGAIGYVNKEELDPATIRRMWDLTKPAAR